MTAIADHRQRPVRPAPSLRRSFVSVALALVSASCGALTTSPSAPPAKAGASAASKPAPPTAPPAASKSGTYTVTFGVANRVGRLGAVQFEATVKGDWQGAAASVQCRNVSGAAMMACNDKGGGHLSCAFVDPKGLATPLSLVTCRLASSKPVAASDFSVKVVDASSPDMKPARASVAVTSVTAGP